VGLVPRGARVLEVGCATGYMSEVLHRRLACRVTGIELLAEAAALAGPSCERVLVGDIEALDLAAALPGERFDLVLFADVLEHLRNPGAVLARVRPLLAADGAVIASIPNVAHGSVRLALLGGEFRYGETGLLDRTHLRFFTRDSVEELFETSGYLVTRWLRRRLRFEQSEVPPPARAVPEEVRAWLCDDPEATTYQFVVRAEPSEAAGATVERRAEQRRADDAARWSARVHQAGRELAGIVGSDPFILIDEDQLRPLLPQPALPFPSRGGTYGGPPADDASAVVELERHRQRGVSFAAVAWPAFWWLEYYAGLARHLAAHYQRVLDTDRVVVFDLRVRRD
jgi:SAM-dependent methyltransferase